MRVYSFILAFIFIGSLQAQTLLEQGAKLYEQRKDSTNVAKAIDFFNQYLQKNPNSIEAHWRLSTAYYYTGNLLKDRKKRKKNFSRGIEHAEKCIELSRGKEVACHFWLGTNTALLKQEKGILSMAFGLDEIFKHFEKSKEIDPTYASAGPYRMLALLSYKAPGFLGGDNKKAYNYIQEAIRISPNEPLNIYFYAKFLIDDGKQKEAIDVMQNFTKIANPKKFAFYESHTSYESILNYIKNKEWLD